MEWLDFSGAPPLLAPRAALALWRGCLEPDRDLWRDLDTEQPVSDYDFACRAAGSQNGIVERGGFQFLALYTECDHHAWDAGSNVICCGDWVPSAAQLGAATWTDALEWEVPVGGVILTNAAVPGSEVEDSETVDLSLTPGRYRVETAFMDDELSGFVHRLQSLGCVKGVKC